MSAWIVSHIPAWLVLIGLVVLVAGGAVLLQMFVRSRYPTLRGDEHNDIIKFTYGVIGFVYAFFMGFVVSSMWGQINTADGKARDEGAAAVQMASDAVMFDQADGDRIRTSLLAYEQAAIAEWPQSGIGRSPEADSALAHLYRAYGQVQATTDAQKTLLARSFTNLDKTSQARTERLLQARTDVGPPWPLWAVIFLTSGLVVGTVVIYGVEQPVMHYPMVAVVGILVAANLFLVVELAHPFIGAVSTSPDPLHEVVAVLSQTPN